jgi:transposase
VRTGSAWRYMPHDLPPWEAVYQQTQRWIKAGVFEEMVNDLRVLLRLSEGRAPDPTATILDSRTPRSTPESGSRGGYDGHKGKKGSKVHAAVDTLGHLLALRVSPANEDDRQEVKKLSEEIQRATGENVELAYVDQGYTGERASGLRGPPGWPPKRASGSKWSSTRRPSTASYYCRRDGWNAISRGHRAFGGW